MDAEGKPDRPRGGVVTISDACSRGEREDTSGTVLRELLAEELVERAGKDGSWVNPAHAIREDDSIIATSFALIALGYPVTALESDRQRRVAARQLSEPHAVALALTGSGLIHVWPRDPPGPHSRGAGRRDTFSRE